MGLLKRVLLSLLVVGLLGTVTGKRVYAVFVSESVNTGNSLASATFTFDTTIAGQTACSSQGKATANNNRNACAGAQGLLFSSATLRYPGDASSIGVTVKNTGSIDAQDLEVSMPTCTKSVTTGASTFLVGDEGTGDPCAAGGLELYIQEADSGGTNLTNGCLYPDPNYSPPGGGSSTDCSLTWAPDSLNDFLNKSCWDLGRVPALASRYFKVGVQFAADAPNTLQGTTASFTLAWKLVSVDPRFVPACSND